MEKNASVPNLGAASVGLGQKVGGGRSSNPSNLTKAAGWQAAPRSQDRAASPVPAATIQAMSAL
jgi:hypothetical protein